jgi:4-hydroxy-tetrahydrodipicolinate reductase
VAQKESVPGTRGGEVGGVAIHSVRSPGVVGVHEVLFGGPGESLTVRHDSLTRESFMPGVLLAVRAAVQKPEFVFGLESLLGLAK